MLENTTSQPPDNLDPKPLDYAATPPWHSRRRTRRILIIGVCLISVITSAYITCQHFRPIIQRNLAVAELHEKCLNYTIPPEQIVYEENHGIPTTAGAGNAPPPTYTISGVLPPDMGGMMSRDFAWYWLYPRFLSKQPAIWRSISTIQFDHLLFLHGRRATGSSLRLVSVEIRPGILHAEPPPMHTCLIQIRVIRPGSVFSTGQELSVQRLNSIGDLSNPPFGLRIYGGQIDPNDASHFTIDFIWPVVNERRTVDGWLQTTDTVKFSLRPTTASSS